MEEVLVIVQVAACWRSLPAMVGGQQLVLIDFAGRSLRLLGFARWPPVQVLCTARVAGRGAPRRFAKFKKYL